jgi:hypothetical protein
LVAVSPEVQTWRESFNITSAERLLLGIVLGIQGLAFLSAFALQREVDWIAFLVRYFSALGLIAIGVYIRGAKAKPRLGMAISGIGFFTAFPAASSVFIYTLMPLQNPIIDPQLTAIGHWFGYDWRTFLLAMLDYPELSHGLAWIYHSAIPQMLGAIVLLSIYGMAVQLHRFLFVGMISLLVTIAIWWAWPSVGYVGVLPYTKEQLLEMIGYSYGADRGGLLTRLLQEGPGIITPKVITGVVGFPSYHIVMAMMVTWYIRGTLFLMPVLLVNLAMVPATLLHGGHHLVDLLGGLVVFIGVALVAARLIPHDPRSAYPRA